VKNLLDNAAKFGPPQGPVEVRLADGELTVRDHGPGIEDHDLPFVFDRFYRALSSRSAPGSGLGLAVVQEIVTWHDGMVTAEQAPDAGTVMRIELPLSPDTIPDADWFARPAQLPQPAEAGRSHA
jgi:two-component system sensor histidine kinase MprB